MIFNDYKDIESDIKSRISNYMTDSNDSKDIKKLVSMIRTYLHEMRVVNEIESYKVNEINNNKFDIVFSKNDNSYKFGISMDLELRNLKINKIISNKILD